MLFHRQGKGAQLAESGAAGAPRDREVPLRPERRRPVGIIVVACIVPEEVRSF